MRLTKILFIFIIILLTALTLIFYSCSIFGAGPAGGEESIQISEETAPEEDLPEDPTEDEFEALLESDDFMEMFNSFYYPDSEVIEAKFIEENREMIFLLLEA